MRQNVLPALILLLLGAALADWLSTDEAHAQAFPPSGGGSTYTHPSAISLPNGIDSADGGTFVGPLRVTPASGQAPVVCGDAACTLWIGWNGSSIFTTSNQYAAFSQLYASSGLQLGNGANSTRWDSATATLDFGSIATGNCADLTMALIANVGDTVFLGTPTAAAVAGSQFTSWISAASTATVRHCCVGAATCDPASGTFRVSRIAF